jgi:type IV secretion system protein VirB9
MRTNEVRAMRRLLPVLLCLMAGCTLGEPPAPVTIPPPPEDLSTWVLPEVVAPPSVAPVATLVPMKEPAPTAAEKVFVFTGGGTYAVPVGVGFPLDIVFGRGEQVHTLTDGDRAPVEDGKARRWTFTQGVDGTGAEQRHHIFVTASEAGLRNGLTVTTTRRTYYLTLESVPRSPVRAVRWKGDPEPVEGVALARKDPGLLPDPTEPKQYHVGYVIESSRHPAPSWTPRQVVDSGTKTFLIYPEVTLFETVPLVRKISTNGPALINARQYLNVTILDELVPRLELRVGIGEQAEVVTITRGRLRTINCPGDDACPAWPVAARELARRHP